MRNEIHHEKLDQSSLSIIAYVSVYITIG